MWENQGRIVDFGKITFSLNITLLICSQNIGAIMKISLNKSQKELVKMMVAACVRRGYLERLHEGTPLVTRTGDYSDVKVIDAEGREIPWNEVSRIDQKEMKTLITGIVNRVYTFLMRTLFSTTEDKAFHVALDRAAAPWVKHWDEPKYLDDFLMSPIASSDSSAEDD